MLAILCAGNYAFSQELESKINLPVQNPFEDYKKSVPPNLENIKTDSAKEIPAPEITDSAPIKIELEKIDFPPVKFKSKWVNKERFTREISVSEFSDYPLPPKEPFPQEKEKNEAKERFHWKPALIQSGIFLGIQHGYRIGTQTRTRRELGGRFFRDWADSVKGLRGWNDSDNFYINYIAHPLQGGLTGRIFVNNSDRAKKQEFGKTKEYWMSRFKALGWSTVWSLQFELGPISEASLGNVGLREIRGRPTMAYVDLVVTPVLGTGLLIGEDAIDKYILKNWVEKNARKTTVKIRILRSVLTPTTSVQNLLRGKVPWKRDNRLLK
jgi:hypothetical protein